jgi:hypothetical protein
MLEALLVVLLLIIIRHHSQLLLEQVLPRQKLEVSNTELECIIPRLPKIQRGAIFRLFPLKAFCDATFSTPGKAANKLFKLALFATNTWMHHKENLSKRTNYYLS